MRTIAWTAAFAAGLIVGAPVGAPALAQVKIGVLNDMSSLYSDIGGKGSLESAKMAAEDAGMVLGQPVQVISADPQNKPDVGSQIARQWDDTRDGGGVTDLPTPAAAPV